MASFSFLCHLPFERLCLYCSKLHFSFVHTRSTKASLHAIDSLELNQKFGLFRFIRISDQRRIHKPFPDSSFSRMKEFTVSGHVLKTLDTVLLGAAIAGLYFWLRSRSNEERRRPNRKPFPNPVSLPVSR